MPSQDKPTVKKRLPAWFSAVAWSLIGIVVALLTICILSASLVWMLRWSNPQTVLTPAGPVTPIPGSTPGAETAVAAPASATVQMGTSSPGEEGGSTSTSAALSQTTEPSSPSPVTPVAASSGIPTAAEPAASTAAASVEEPLSPTPDGSAPTTSAGTAASELTATAAAANLTSPSPEVTPTETASPPPTPTATSTATPTPTPTPEPEPQVYIVQRDDWLSKLADKFYGDILAYPAIAEATNAKATEDDSFAVIEDPDLIEVGQKLWIPTPAEAAVLLEEE